MEIGIVIKSYSRNLITRDKLSEWDICFSPFRIGKGISEEAAERYIHKHGLVKVLENKDGAIWDTPDRAFLRKFKGCFDKPTNIQKAQFRRHWV